MAVVNVGEGQIVDAAGNLSDVYDITFTIPNQPGTFTTQIPQSGDPVAAANAAIQAKTSQVEGIASL